MTSVLIVGEGLFCEGLMLLLAEDPGIDVIGTVRNCTEAYEFALRENPDAVLVDQVRVSSNQAAFSMLMESVDSLRVISLTLSDNKMVVHNRQQVADVTVPVLMDALHF